MAIQALCRSCNASFLVSDKFDGLTGPCPKCKVPITISKIDFREVPSNRQQPGGPWVSGCLIWCVLIGLFLIACSDGEGPLKSVSRAIVGGLVLVWMAGGCIFIVGYLLMGVAADMGSKTAQEWCARGHSGGGGGYDGGRPDSGWDSPS